MRRLLVLASIAALTIAAVTVQMTTLPSGWHISKAPGAVAATGTMPQGIALSPDGSKLAVVESGFNPPALRVLSVPDLHLLATIPIKDGFGRPGWRDATTILVAGASMNQILRVDVKTQSIASIEDTGKYPDDVTVRGDAYAESEDLSNGIRWTTRSGGGAASTGSHPAAVAMTGSGIYVANKGESSVTFAPLDGSKQQTIAVDLHPSALALSPNEKRLYVACADADSVDVVDTAANRVVGRINVGLREGAGASPNALAVARDGTVYVSLGAENAVAEIENNIVVARHPAGWYPTGVAVDAQNVYVLDGKGESSHANPQFQPYASSHGPGYVASTIVGSVRAVPRHAFNAASTAQVAANVPKPQPTPPQTVVRAGGPIRHVIYIIKENRTYDQVLGDVAGANGDPKLTWYGENVTPNQHAIVERFGIFDNAYTDAQVSASGHNWSTAAFGNDYLERFWPAVYGNRRDLYDFEDGAVAATPRNGYLWDDANRHGVSFRDYGEFTSFAVIGGGFATTSMPGLRGKIDERYTPFDLRVSDEARVDEWKREFDGFVERGDLPSLEIVRLPNDHTSGTKPGTLTPQAFVAQNDHAFGRLLDIVSHSKYWASTVVIAIEDDAQNGPDHVDDQRTTLYVASPYAARGVHHAHYSTSSVLRTIELLLGLPPMSIYDAVAPPLYDAFALHPQLAPFEAVPPKIDVSAQNKETAYGAARSARMDFSRADAANEEALNDILAHAAGKP